MTDTNLSQAATWIKKVESERGKGVPVKARPTARTVLSAAPELQAAFIRQVVAAFARLGARGSKPHGSNEWFRGRNVHTGAEELGKIVMRRRLPFGQPILCEMLDQIARMDFITFAPLIDPLVRELEKRSVESTLSPSLRKAALRVADALLVKGWPPSLAEDAGFPRAGDRKLAARIYKITGSK